MYKIKRLIAILLSLLLVAGNICSLAEEPLEITVSADNYATTTNRGNTNSWESGHLSFASAKVTWNLNAPKAGKYLVRSTFGSHLGKSANITIGANGEDSGSIVFDPPDKATSFSYVSNFEFGYVYLNEGANTFFMSTDVNLNTYDKLHFILQPEEERSGITIGDAQYEEGGIYPRGIDVISITYAAQVSSDSLSSIALEDEDGNPISINAVVDEDGYTVLVALKETLDYSTGYTMIAAGICDIDGNELEDNVIEFSTGTIEDDKGKSSVVIESFEIEDARATITGTVKSSVNFGISGRNVEFSLALPENDEVVVANGTSGEDGLFELTYILSSEEDNVSGECTGYIKAEYAISKKSATCEYISESIRSTIAIPANEYASTTNSGNTTSWEQGQLSISAATVTWNVPALKRGVYLVTGTLGSHLGKSANMAIGANGEQTSEFVFDPEDKDTSFSYVGNYEYGYVYLNEGDNTFYISTDINVNIYTIRFIPQKPGERIDLNIGDESYEPEKLYPRGTDVIKASYSSGINAESLKDISLTDEDGNVISTKCITEENDSSTLLVMLTETLDYDKTYTLQLKNIRDIKGYTLDEENISFTTGDSSCDAGTSTVEITSFEITEGIATVNGIIKSSLGIGISGRKAKFFLSLAETTEKFVADGISREDGVFTLTYTLTSEEDDVAGDCTAKIRAEYSNETANETVYYISSGRIAPIFSELKSTTQGNGTTEGSVQYVFEQNMEALDINPATDLHGVNPEGFYELFIGAEVSTIREFKELYSSLLTIEKINQATDSDSIEAILSDNANLSALGIDEDKLAVLNTEYKEALYLDLYNAERLKNTNDFKIVFDTLYNKGLCGMFGFSDVTLKEATLSANIGQEIILSAETSTGVKNIKKVDFEISFGTLPISSIVDFNITSESGDVTYTREGNIIKAQLTVNDISKEFTKIAKLAFTCGQSAVTTITVKGTAFGETGTDYDANVLLNEKTYYLTVASNPTKLPGGGYSSGGGFAGGLGGNSGGNVITPQSPSDYSGTTEDKTSAFVDIQQVEWAQEAINGLLAKSIVAMPDDKMFNPDRLVTRAEFVKMIVLAYNLPHMGKKPEFNDIDNSSWYYQYVQAAVYNKLLTGDNTGNFNPNAYITREDMCVIISRLPDMNAAKTEYTFADDSSISTYAKDAVYSMYLKGVVNGTGNDKFEPKSNSTRAMAAKVIWELIKEDA